ncbi:MAG: cadherin domain-containing protein, partial [Sphaerospermopsis kisseleviana]
LGTTTAITGTITNDDSSNQAPANLTISNTSIAENQAVGTVVGNFTTTDPDVGNTFTYSLVTGTGSTDNASFTIVGNQLKTNAAFNFEAKNSYSIRVRTTDQSGLFFEKALTIGVNNVNETPTNLSISNTSIAENQAVGTVVGNFSTIDPDVGNTFTYSLVSGTGSTNNASFTIVGNQLKTNSSVIYNNQNTYNIRVRTTDQGGLYFEKPLTIQLTPVPTLVGTWSADGMPSAKAVTVAGNYAYVVDDKLEIIDISVRTNPTFKGSYGSLTGYEVQVVGNYAYVAGDTGLSIIDITNPSTPTLKGSYAGAASGVQVVANYAYVAAGSGLKILDITNPATPTLQGSYAGAASDVQVVANYAYVTASSGLKILDVTNPATPSLKASYTTFGAAHGVQVVGKYAYVTNFGGIFATYGGLEIIDVTNPATPTYKG